MATSPSDFLAKWHQVVASRDMDLLEQIVSESVEFHTPLYLKPKRGALIVKAILASAVSIFQDFVYFREWVMVSEDGNEADLALEFGANIPNKDESGTLPLKGLDLIKIRRGPDNLFRIVHFEVMIRPVKTLIRFGELQSAGVMAMAKKFGAKL
ncbi:hypothetical protein HDU78_011365 [Chytriomyces hyalinus]|nr:hypothetical protein HDU78_011365 [Chytriomyces hyalinus]